MKFLILLFFILSSHVLAKHPPVILVPGWGPHTFTSMHKIQGFLEADGLSKDRIYEFTYPWRKCLDDIADKLAPKFEIAFSRHPGEQFVVITHSLGQAAALYTLLEKQMSHRISHFVSLAGAIHGQDKEPWPYAGKAVRSMVPYKNPFIMDFLGRHSQALSELNKCSLYSYEDGRVDSPHDSSAFDDGTNIVVPNTKHMHFIQKRHVYSIIRNECGIVSAGGI